MGFAERARPRSSQLVGIQAFNGLAVVGAFDREATSLVAFSHSGYYRK